MFLFLVILLVWVAPLCSSTCKQSTRHKLIHVTCTNFDHPILNLTENVEVLTFKNVRGHLDLSNITLKHLKYMVVSHSKVTNLTFGTFPELTFLTFLKNEQLPRDFSFANGILWLSLVANNHTLLPTVFHTLVNMTWLHIQNQNFEHVTGEFFKKNVKLHELSIRNCHLSKIDSGAFDNLLNLEILSMNFNNLTSFKEGTFKNLQRLRILEIHHNKFVNFDLGQFDGLSGVEVLGLPSCFLKNVEAKDLMTQFPKLQKFEVKKKDFKNKKVKELLQELRIIGVEHVGTPHDCHKSTNLCNLQ